MSGDFGVVDNATAPTNATVSGGSCAAQAISRPLMLPYSEDLILTVRSLQTLSYILIFTLGIFLNVLTITLVAKHKKLRTRTFAIAMQVVVIDLILSSTVLALRPISAIANQWLFGEAMCILTGYMYLSYLFLRQLLMLMFVVDRFLSVFYLYSYPKHSTVIMVTASIVTWVFSLGARIIGFPGVLDCYSYVATSYLCVHSSRCSTECARAANVNLGIVVGPATIIPVVLYALLYWKGKSLRKKHAKTAPSSVSSDGSLISEKSRKHDWRANITFFLLFVAVFALTTPVVSTSLILAAIIRMTGPSPVLYVLSSINSTLTSLLVIADPIVILRHRDIRNILGKYKRKWTQTSCCSTLCCD
jgi:hypothetical protein